MKLPSRTPFRRLLLTLCGAAVGCTLGLSSCGPDNNSEDGQKVALEKSIRTTPVEITYNPAVESFTTGTVGRQSTVSVTLVEPVSREARLGKYIALSPKAKGQWKIDDDDPRKLVFTPESEFDRGKTYTARLDLKGLLPGRPDAGDFEFSFRTLPASAAAEPGSFIVEDDHTFTVEGSLFTADYEDSARINRMSRWEGLNRGTVHWTHSADGREHRFVVSGIQPRLTSSALTLTVQDPKAGYDRQEVLSVPLPSSHSFEIHSVEYVTHPEKYIEVRFSQQIDPKQDLDGIVWLDDLSCVRRIEGNKVLLFPSSRHSDLTEATLCVDPALLSAAGKRFDSEIRRTIPLESRDPAVRFIGRSTILPPAEAIVGNTTDRPGRGIPFQAVGLRAVRVDVFRILESSMGQFLQENDLSDNDGGSIMRTARPVASRTLFLDQNGSSESHRWATYSLDLDDLIQPEPGALYRISLSFDRSMAALSCVPPDERLTPQAARIADEARLAAMKKRFDQGGYYWSGDDYDWNLYEWKERNNPCSPSYYFNRTAQRNLSVTDLGAIAKASDEPQMLFLVHSIATAEPVKEARIELRNFQNQPVGSGTTDSDGHALIRYENSRPYYAVISKDKQRTYLKVNAGSELSTSTFDVSGEQVQEGLKGFVWTERGVWRPGDTIYMNFTTAGARLPKGHPVTVELRSPLGQLYQKRVATQATGGIYSFVLSTAPNAPTGVWSAAVSVGGARFSKRLRIEAVKPNRLKIDLRFPKKYIQRGQPIDATLHGEWLTGTPVGNLRYVIETEFTALHNGFPEYKGYVFDNPYRSFRPESAPEITGTTDADGDARITAVLNGGEKAGGLLQAHFTTRLFEPSGEASIDGTSLIYSPFDTYVGIRPPKGADDRLDTDRDYTFDLVTVQPDGRPAADRRIEICVYKVEWHWWWSSTQSQLARHVSDRSLSPVQRETIETSVFGKGTVELNFPRDSWGTYYLTARDLRSGHEAATLLYVDWPDYGNRHTDGEGAMRLAVSLDKKSYRVGERATVSFPATAGSRAIISVENGSRVLQVFPVECTRTQEKFTFEVTPEMQPNAYLNVTLLQPYGTVENDLPVRLYGIVPLSASSDASRLEPVITAPDEVLPESEMTVTVSEKQGRACAYTLAVVDEGLLDLTRFRTPDPWGTFNARVALGVSTWDIYNDVLGAYGGRIEQMFAIGGDDALTSAPKASVNRFPPVVRYLGVFELKAGKKATHRIQLPAYMGRVRVMAVAVSQQADDGNGAWGSAERSVAVRAPLMVLGTAPRSVAPGDEFVVAATLIATRDGIGQASATLTADKEIFTVAGPTRQNVTLSGKGEKIVLFRLRVKDAVPAGTSAGGHIEITASGGGRQTHYGMDIPVRTLSLPVASGQSHTVEAGKSWNGNTSLPGMPGTQRLMLEVSAVQPLNAAQRMEYLSTYPYGCIEQITSAVFPLLYLPALADLSEKERDIARRKVESVLERYKQYATPDGSMGYWPGSVSPNTWGSAYALHFMTVAGHKGYTMPAGVYDRLKAAVKSNSVRWNSTQNPGANLIQAYQLYALALSGSSETGAMNRLRQNGNLTPEARWMLAAAYGAAGRTDLGRTVAAEAHKAAAASDAAQAIQRRLTYGSPERARAVELLAESLLGMRSEAAKSAQAVSRHLVSDDWMSTQTTAWSLLAMGEYAARNGQVSALNFEWSAGGHSGRVESDSRKLFWSGEWSDPASGKLSVTNRTKGTLYIRAVASGISSGRDVAAASNGLEVTVRYTDSKGNPIDIASLKQGTDFVSEITVRNLTAETIDHLMLSEPVASGWEIRPDAGGLPAGVEYRDLRDERADSYLPTLAGGASVTVRTWLNAAYAGRYTLPAIRCGAMYDGRVAGNTASAVTTVN